jgi:hypothetical protein
VTNEQMAETCGNRTVPDPLIDIRGDFSEPPAAVSDLYTGHSAAMGNSRHEPGQSGIESLCDPVAAFQCVKKAIMESKLTLGPEFYRFRI